MSVSQHNGPELDGRARREILREDDRHRLRLIEIESSATTDCGDLLAAENDTHLRRLTEIYSQLADRRVDAATPASGTRKPANSKISRK